MQGYVEKKSEKNKKWKALYFVLLVDATDTHLYLYDNPKRTKPKGLIDLSCAYLHHVRNAYFVHWSILYIDINMSKSEINNIDVCTLFLKAALRDTIVKLIENKQSCELNPTKMDSPEDTCSGIFITSIYNYYFNPVSIDPICNLIVWYFYSF